MTVAGCCAALAWATWAAVLSPGPQPHLPTAVRSSIFVEHFDLQQVGQQVWEVNPLSSPPLQHAAVVLNEVSPVSLHCCLMMKHRALLVVSALNFKQSCFTACTSTFTGIQVIYQLRFLLQACTLAGKLNTFNAADSKEIPAAQATGSLQHADNPKTAAPEAHAGTSQPECSTGSTCRPAWLPVQCNTHALHSFYEHADNSNDIFRVAARAVAMVTSAFYMRIAMHGDGSGVVESQSVQRDRMLLEAWKPFQAVFKAVWWEHVPMPEELSDEAAWRSQLKCAP